MARLVQEVVDASLMFGQDLASKILTEKGLSRKGASRKKIRGTRKRRIFKKKNRKLEVAKKKEMLSTVITKKMKQNKAYMKMMRAVMTQKMN